MWKMLHKHSACQDKKLLPREPGTTLVGVLEDRTEVFYLWTVSVLFCLCLMVSWSVKIHQLILFWISSDWRCRWNKQGRSPDAFGTIWHHHWSDVDDQMFQGTGDVCFSFDCPRVLMPCQSAEMFWLLLLGSCLLPLLHQMIWKPWPFSHVCDIHTIKHTGCQSQLLPWGKGSAVRGEGAHAAQAPADSSSEDARCPRGLL